MSHHSRNRYKYAYFSALIDDWLAHDDMMIYLRLVLPTELKHKETPIEKLSRYVGDLSVAMAMGGGIATDSARMLTRPRFKSQQQVALEEMILSRNKRLKSIEKIAPQQSDLIQFLSTLTGSIRAYEDVLERANQRNPAKALCIAKIRAAFGVKDFSKQILNTRLQLTVA